MARTTAPASIASRRDPAFIARSRAATLISQSWPPCSRIRSNPVKSGTSPTSASVTVLRIPRHAHRLVRASRFPRSPATLSSLGYRWQMRIEIGSACSMSFLPERLHPAASLHDLAELAHRGVAGEDVQRLVRRDAGQGGVQSGLAPGYYPDVGEVGPGVLHAQGDFLGPGPADDQARKVRHELLEVHIPEPGEVLPVDHRVAVRGQHVLAARAPRNEAEGGVVRRGVLDEGQYGPAAVRSNLLTA